MTETADRERHLIAERDAARRQVNSVRLIAQQIKKTAEFQLLADGESHARRSLSLLADELLRALGPAFPAGQTPSERMAAILDAYEIPQPLRAAWRQIDEEA